MKLLCKDNKTHRYFTCDPGMGSFVKPVKCDLGTDLLTAIPARFNTDTLEEDLKKNKMISKNSNWRVKFVGFKEMKHLCTDYKSYY